MLDELGGHVQIGGGGFAVFVLLGIDDMHGRPCGAVMHAGAREQQVMRRIAATERKVAAGDGQHILDQRAGDADAAILAHDAAGIGQDLFAGWRDRAEADGF